MAAPQVSWRLRDNTDVLSKWAIGTIDAGTISNEQGVLIWNNFGGTSDLSTMTNCTLTTKDSGGNNTGELVNDTWVEVRVDSLSESGFTPVGGDVTHPVQAGGNTTNANGTYSPGTQEILGVQNDATAANSKGNYTEATLRANVPGTATAGNVTFLTRIAYQYV